MKPVHTILLVLCLLANYMLKAEERNLDSATAALVLKELASISKNVDWSDPKNSKLGYFYRAAPLILYRGEDKKRAWKDFANYLYPPERKGVDEICEKINQSINQDLNYKITQYFTETESEGTWHVLVVTYMKKGVEKKTSFAFLKLGNRFGLGDID